IFFCNHTSELRCGLAANNAIPFQADCQNKNRDRRWKMEDGRIFFWPAIFHLPSPVFCPKVSVGVRDRLKGRSVALEITFPNRLGLPYHPGQPLRTRIWRVRINRRDATGAEKDRMENSSLRLSRLCGLTIPLRR